jgi:hypothetical protein
MTSDGNQNIAPANIHIEGQFSNATPVRDRFVRPNRSAVMFNTFWINRPIAV